jgi:hypothetical protein
MRKIKPENIKVGDFIYLVFKDDKNTRYILKKIPNKKNKTPLFKWWILKNKLEKPHLLEPDYMGMFDDVNMENESFERYEVYKLNKKEITEFNKLFILMNLK